MKQYDAERVYTLIKRQDAIALLEPDSNNTQLGYRVTLVDENNTSLVIGVFPITREAADELLTTPHNRIFFNNKIYPLSWKTIHLFNGNVKIKPWEV